MCGIKWAGSSKYSGAGALCIVQCSVHCACAAVPGEDLAVHIRKVLLKIIASRTNKNALMHSLDQVFSENQN